MNQQTGQDSAAPSAANMNTIDMPPPEASHFSLPAELLNHIATLTVVEDPDADQAALLLEQREQDDYGVYGYKSRVLAFPSPAVVRTCTALEAIALPIYYGQNTFRFCLMRPATY